MKRIVIRHHLLNAYLMGPGGSQYVMLEAAIAFSERGFETYIDSPFIYSRGKLLEIARFFGVSECEVNSIGIGDPGRADLVINTSGDVLSGSGDVMYVHYPFFMDYTYYYSPLQGIYSLLANAYSLLNTIALPLLTRRIRLYIANSSFTANFLIYYFGIKPVIIHPPVNIDDIKSLEPLPREERDNYVLVVSRISPEKQVHRAVDIARYARKLGLRIIVAGTLSSYIKPYYDSLVEYASKMGVDDIVEFVINVPRDKLVELYRRALVYVHLTPKEHFGISIVEAMAAGTPTILPIDSGAWIDIAQRNRNIALPYSDVQEAVCRLHQLVENKVYWSKLSKNSYTRALNFDRRVFRRKLYEAVKSLINQRDEEQPRS